MLKTKILAISFLNFNLSICIFIYPSAQVENLRKSNRTARIIFLVARGKMLELSGKVLVVSMFFSSSLSSEPSSLLLFCVSNLPCFSNFHLSLCLEEAWMFPLEIKPQRPRATPYRASNPP